MAKKRSPRKRTSPSNRKSSGTKKPLAKPGVGPQRLNKILAAAGLGSRREVEELILQGRVDIDRETVTDLGRKVDPSQVTIQVDGQTLKKFRPVYFALNKPKGVLSTNADPSGRMRVIDLVPDSARVFSVGRLDKSSEGLILLTNDGELAQKIAHPRYRVQKTYYVVVAGFMTKEELAKLRKGVYLAEGFARIDGATIRKQRKGSTELEITLSEGKNREIRRILARAGHKVVILRRIAIGPLRLGQLPVGASRELTSTEIKALYAATSSAVKPGKKSANSPKKKASKSKGAPPTAVATDTASTLDADWDDDEALTDFDASYDDDFITVFGDSASEGSVLAYEEAPAPSSPSKARGAQSAKRQGRGRGPAKGKTTGRNKPSGRNTASGKPRVKKAATAGKPGNKKTSSHRSSSTARVSKKKPTRTSKKASPASRTGGRSSAKRGGKKKR